MEQVIEQSVLRAELPAKKIILVKIFKIVSVILALTAFIVGFLMSFSDGSAFQVIISILIIFTPTAFFISLYFFLDKILIGLTKEFDYFINGNKFLIVKVYKNTKRKKYFECKVSDFTVLGKIESEDFSRYEKRKSGKNYNAVLNVDNIENIYFALVSEDILFFEPNEEMLKGIRLTLGRDITVGKKEGYKY